MIPHASPQLVALSPRWPVRSMLEHGKSCLLQISKVLIWSHNGYHYEKPLQRVELKKVSSPIFPLRFDGFFDDFTDVWGKIFWRSLHKVTKKDITLLLSNFVEHTFAMLDAPSDRKSWLSPGLAGSFVIYLTQWKICLRKAQAICMQEKNPYHLQRVPHKPAITQTVKERASKKPKRCWL